MSKSKLNKYQSAHGITNHFGKQVFYVKIHMEKKDQHSPNTISQD